MHPVSICFIVVGLVALLVLVLRYTLVWRRLQPYVGKKCGDLSSANLPIDAVITWVDSSDSTWQRLKKKYYTNGDISPLRFPDVKYPDLELETCVALIKKNIPWIRKIFIVVSDGQKPSFVRLHDSKVRVVEHKEIWPEESKSALPVFNSHAIEANLHRIPGLAERFIYFNDDVYVVKPQKTFGVVQRR